jgi:ParB family chromosome partitioning protein
MAKNYGLGRGLSSLIPPKTNGSFAKPSATSDQRNGLSYERNDDAPYVATPAKRQLPTVAKSENKSGEKTGITEVPTTSIRPNSHQPRLSFDEEKLRELAESIKTHGIIQPLVVMSVPGGYELIAGERRLRAAKLAGLTSVPVVVRQAPKKEKFELAILENVQRHDLSPMEEARAYRRLMDEFSLSQEDVALRIGKSRSAVANAVRFLDLPLEAQRSLEAGEISPGHAKVILSIANPEKRRALLDAIIREHLTVRETERRATSVSERVVESRSGVFRQDPQLKASEEELREALRTKVRVSNAGTGGAKVAIEFASKRELVEFMNRIRE